jgi:hypothetical protein
VLRICKKEDAASSLFSIYRNQKIKSSQGCRGGDAGMNKCLRGGGHDDDELVGSEPHGF